MNICYKQSRRPKKQIVRIHANTVESKQAGKQKGDIANCKNVYNLESKQASKFKGSAQRSGPEGKSAG